MSVKVYKTQGGLSGWRNVGNTKIRVRIGSAWKDVVRVRIYKSGAWKLVHPPPAPPPAPPPPSPPPPSPPPPSNPLSVNITPTFVGKVKRGCPPNGPITTASVTATASDGVAPYTYQWEVVSWDSIEVPVADAPMASVTTFTLSEADGSDASHTSTFRCRVTDSVNATATDTVTVEFHTTSLL